MTDPAAERLSPDSPEPLYVQLSALIEARISSGAMQPGERLESEHDLAARFDVSRITVRHAIGRLVEKDLLVRRQGKGTFVSRPPIGQRIDDPIFDAILAQGERAQAELIVFETRVPPASVAEAFGAAPGQLLTYLERRYSLDEEVIAWASAWLVVEAANISMSQARAMSTAQILSNAGMPLAKTRAVIRAVPCPEALRDVFGSTQGAPSLRVRRRRLTASETLIELGEIHFRGDTYEIALDANGHGKGDLILV
jgi:GntR family transcriptional regulator